MSGAGVKLEAPYGGACDLRSVYHSSKSRLGAVRHQGAFGEETAVFKEGLCSSGVP